MFLFQKHLLDSDDGRKSNENLSADIGHIPNRRVFNGRREQVIIKENLKNCST
jgi:hypothetical protein